MISHNSDENNITETNNQNNSSLINKNHNTLVKYVPRNYFKGEEYNYSYSYDLNNKMILNKYGFYYEGNNDNYYEINLKLSKKWFTHSKFLICEKIGCFPRFNKQLFESNPNNLEILYLNLIIYQFKPNNHLYKTAKAYINSEDKVNNLDFQKRLIDDKWINYTTEIYSINLLYKIINPIVYNTKFGLDKTIHIQQTSRNICKINDNNDTTNEADLNEKHKRSYHCKIRTIMVSVYKEKLICLWKFILGMRNRQKFVLIDQFQKLKSHYV